MARVEKAGTSVAARIGRRLADALAGCSSRFFVSLFFQYAMKILIFCKQKPLFCEFLISSQLAKFFQSSLHASR
ncbi:MAG: hypothetical protein CMM93_02270 [Rickettsiales bacterium]|nr:hypothetical protein [Rickettsiales bacterium]